MKTPPDYHFTKELFQFLVELKFNNDRAWFNANKARYEQHLKRPMLAFIAAFQKPLARVNPAFIADPRPVGGSMFRIYRDTRFAKDKTPYKTHAAAHFFHRAAHDVHAPGFYLHLEPGESFVGAGIWQPEAAPAKAIRSAIVKRGAEWKKLRKLPLWGESLKRAPKGFDPAHPLIEDLKRKHFITWVDVTDRQVLDPKFLARVADACRRMDPLQRFLCSALGLKG